MSTIPGIIPRKAYMLLNTVPQSYAKPCFLIMDVLIKTKPDDPVYLFMDKKRSEGKPYYFYTTAGANKFLRIYYGRVKEYLASLPKKSDGEAENNGI